MSNLIKIAKSYLIHARDCGGMTHVQIGNTKTAIEELINLPDWKFPLAVSDYFCFHKESRRSVTE